MFIPPLLFSALLWHLPRMVWYRLAKRRKADPNDLRVIFFSDNLDEVNGIANNSRQVVGRMREMEHKVHLVGTAFYSRPEGVVENHFTVLLPQYFSMEQLGYKDSELSAPRIGAMLRFAERFRPDLVELETPSVGAWAALIACKIMGIKVISHYRTDVMGYVELLVKSKLMYKEVLLWMQAFSHLTAPVVTPSKDFTAKVIEQMRLKPERVVMLPRGIRTDWFDPNLRDKGYWQKFHPHTSSDHTKFLYVGRVSKEKALPFLETIWRDFRKQQPQAELLVVGHGPYLEEMKANFADCPEVAFAGQQGGSDLASAYADADWLVFPSGTDTFGNVVVEALASGTPAIVSNRGGPKDIVENCPAGIVIPFEDCSAWVQALCHADQSKRSGSAYAELRSNAFERSRTFTLDAACNAQWKFFQSLFAKN